MPHEDDRLDEQIQSWLAEAGIPLDAPWIYLGTPERVISHDSGALYFDAQYYHPERQGLVRTLLPFTGDQLSDQWDGYRLELLGTIQHIHLDGIRLDVPTPPGPSGPRLRVLDRLGGLLVDVTLRRQRCYRPTGSQDTDVPPLVAEIHWWPGAERQQPFFRNTTGDPNQLRPDDVRQARRDWGLLNQIPLIDQGGRHRIGDDPTSGELALAREAEQIKKQNPTWTWLRIVHHIGLVQAIEDEGRSRNPEEAALRRLERWRKQLRELGE